MRARAPWLAGATLVGLIGASLVSIGAPATAATGLDVNDRAAVLAKWNTITAAAPDMGFTGDVSTCRPGTTSAAYRQAGIDQLNAYRALAGVADLTENTTWSAQAQSAAMLMAANRSLSHSPPSTWTCYNLPGTTTPAPGVAAAGRSNLAGGSAGPAAITQYMEDDRTPSLGHRRWAICPYVTQVGMGDVPATAGDLYGGGYNAHLHNFGSTSTWTSRDGFVAWPNKGLVPWKQAADRGLLSYFSLQVPSGTSVTSPSVSVSTNSGPAVSATVTNTDRGYCGNGVMWAPSRQPVAGETWTITVNGLSTGSTTYSTTFFGQQFSAAGTPTISGNVAVGSTLTANAGSWTPTPSLGYQWFAGGAAIAGATGKTFTPTSAQVGKAITVQVTGTLAGYDTTSRTSAATTAVPTPELPKVVAGTATISGSASVGSTLNANPGNWTPAGTNLTYQWKANDVAISGATGASFAPTAAQVGAAITVTLTGTAGGYVPASATSAAVTVTAGQLATQPVAISGSPAVGSTLSATSGEWGPAPVALAYQWYRDGAAISGATSASLPVTAAYVGSSLTVKVTGTKAGYAAATVSSAPTAAVYSPTPGTITSGTPTITGTPRVDSQLSATPGVWSDGATFSYQWLVNGTAVAGATGSTFVPTADQVGRQVSVAVTGAKAGLASKTVTSQSVTVGQGQLETGGMSLRGVFKVGETITADTTYSAWGPAPVTLTYQWYRVSAGQSLGTLVKTTVNDNRYPLGSADEGFQIRAVVVGSKTGYTTVTSSTGAYGPVLAGEMRLIGGQTLTGDGELFSKSGQFRVKGSQGVNEYDANGRNLWSVPYASSRLAMQTDGNLVLYTDAGAVWSSGTWGNPGAYAVVQDDANFVVYSAAGKALWSNNAFDDEVTPSVGSLDQGLRSGHQLISADRRIRLVMQPDGNLVGYGPSGVLWATNTWGNPGARLVMQGDGNLVVYPKGSGPALWSAATHDRGARKLVVQSDGNIVVYGPSGPLWQTQSRA